MNEDERELELEDAIFDEISDEEEDAVITEAALLDEDEDEDEFVQGSISVDEISTGFSASLPAREIDVDEDTQGDEVEPDIGGSPMTEYERSSEPPPTLHGDEVELDLDDAFTTGRTVAKAPEVD